MKHYKDENGKVHAFENDKQMQEYAKVTLTAITDAEKDELRYTIERKRADLKTARDNALNDITHTLDDGSVYQVRPSDLSNFNLAINEGADEKWILADNTVRMTTVAEMTECLMSGIAQGKVIWREYANNLETLQE